MMDDLMGKSQTTGDDNSIAALVTSLLVHNQEIRNLWELEATGIRDPFEWKLRDEIDEVVKDHFMENLRKDSEGRYEVKLPWMLDKNLPEYRDIAERRLEGTTTKLKLERKYDAYDMVFEEGLKEDIIEKVPLEELSKSGCYLPHRGIFKENSTTKISIAEEDRDYLRFRWWKDGESKEQVFRHRRVVFGVTCSPFILGAVIQHHLENTCKEHKEIAEKLLRSFYVDNCITSLDTETQKGKLTSL
ncbi:transposon Tf2-6 polyprotein [Trichonephila clavipes]|uniref:Transposon Tf2-6 polyprotein n=1 Tax=Trichonephila clavipes TaxID=2585209 RepID=A0A8X6SWW4_TRICX|nr:transposon Tf2-6 polyprotein [Trichonephila clavipes]